METVLLPKMAKKTSVNRGQIDVGMRNMELEMRTRRWT